MTSVVLYNFFYLITKSFTTSNSCSKFFKSLTQLRRFLEFVTTTPRLSSRGFTSLYPKLKVVRKVRKQIANMNNDFMLLSAKSCACF